VTNDSAVTGEKSGLTVMAVNQTVAVCNPAGGSCPAPPGSPNVFSIMSLSEVQAGDGGVVGHEGDSGGPWVVHNGPGTVAIAGVTSNGFCSDGACTTMFYTQIGAIDSQFGESSP
jgi:hypothetical protein